MHKDRLCCCNEVLAHSSFFHSASLLVRAAFIQLMETSVFLSFGQSTKKVIPLTCISHSIPPYFFSVEKATFST